MANGEDMRDPLGGDHFKLESMSWRSGAETTEEQHFISVITDNTSQQDFGTRKVYCVSNVTFHAESKYAINIFPSATVFVQWPFLIIDFSEFLVFSSVIFLYMNKYFK